MTQPTETGVRGTMMAEQNVDFEGMIRIHFHWNNIRVLILQSSGMYHRENYPEDGGRKCFRNVGSYQISWRHIPKDAIRTV
jgi:hypothetical protein